MQKWTPKKKNTAQYRYCHAAQQHTQSTPLASLCQQTRKNPHDFFRRLCPSSHSFKPTAFNGISQPPLSIPTLCCPRVSSCLYIFPLLFPFGVPFVVSSLCVATNSTRPVILIRPASRQFFPRQLSRANPLDSRPSASSTSSLAKGLRWCWLH